MNRPFARILWRLADEYNMVIMPKETGTAFDPSERMVGSGPWIWEGWEPSVNVRLKRNPEWHRGPEQPYWDGINVSVIPQPANQLVQFKAGNLDLIGTVSPDEVPNLKKDRSDAVIDPRKTFGFGYLAFGEPRGDAPWKDERVRWAMSMALDRDAMISAVYNASALDGAGLGVKVSDLVGWHNILPAGYADQSIDPREDAANTGQHIKFDLTEAKRLLDAAGFADGFSAPYHYTTIYGAAWKLEAELYPQLLNQIGIELQTQVDDFASVYTPKTFVGDFDGIAFLLQAFPDLGDYLTEMYTPGAGRNHSKVNDPAILAKVQQIEGNLDGDARNEAIRNLHTDLAKPMWYVPGVAWQLSWQASDPRIQGRENSHGNGRGQAYRFEYPRYWFED
jgi:ABC-type transport system substrate-binding protein